MDRSSIASSAMASDPTAEFYDTPARHTSCSCCPAPPSCACCAGPSNGPSQQHQHHHGHSHYQNPACLMDPMENYDVPPTHPHGNAGISPKDMQCGVPTRSVNGEGKMPLVSALPPRAANAHAIYAQVDKTKKTSRPVPHFVNCDNNHHQQPIYENHGTNPHCQQHQQQIIMQQQPTYANLECKAHNKGKPPAPTPEQPISATSLAHTCPVKMGNPHQPNNPASNYVNLEFADSLLLYENSQEIRQEPVGAANPVENHTEKCTDLVTASSSEKDAQKDTTTKNCNEDAKKEERKEELEKIPEEDTKENDYENTKVLLDKNNLDKCGQEEQHESSGPSAQEDSTEICSSEMSKPTEAIQAGTSKEINGGGTNAEDEPSLPLRRSSSVPCKGGHANRGSASSSDSGVSGDGGLFFDDSSPLNDIGR